MRQTYGLSHRAGRGVNPSTPAALFPGISFLLLYRNLEMVLRLMVALTIKFSVTLIILSYYTLLLLKAQ